MGGFVITIYRYNGNFIRSSNSSFFTLHSSFLTLQRYVGLEISSKSLAQFGIYA